jgi:hypothetical protein
VTNKEVIEFVKAIAHAVFEMADSDLTPGEETEVIEHLCNEQNKWETNSVGWKVLESLKEYIRYKGPDLTVN